MDTLRSLTGSLRGGASAIAESVASSLRPPIGPAAAPSAPTEFGWGEALLCVIGILLAVTAYIFAKRSLVYIKEATRDAFLVCAVTLLVYCTLLIASILCPKTSFEGHVLWAWGKIDQLAISIGLKPALLAFLGKYVPSVAT